MRSPVTSTLWARAQRRGFRLLRCALLVGSICRRSFAPLVAKKLAAILACYLAGEVASIVSRLPRPSKKKWWHQCINLFSLRSIGFDPFTLSYCMLSLGLGRIPEWNIQWAGENYVLSEDAGEGTSQCHCLQQGSYALARLSVSCTISVCLGSGSLGTQCLCGCQSSHGQIRLPTRSGAAART